MDNHYDGKLIYFCCGASHFVSIGILINYCITSTLVNPYMCSFTLHLRLTEREQCGTLFCGNQIHVR